MVFTSPELVLDSRKWRNLVASPEFQTLWGLVAVDEVHCIIHWGTGKDGQKAFRPAWGRIHEIKALVPSNVPWLLTTATLATYEIPLICASLLLPDDIKIMNLGNNRPEIFYKCCQIEESMKTFADLTDLVIPKGDEPLRSTMVFFDDRVTLHQVHEQFWKILPAPFREQVATFHALRSEASKKEIMQKFREGEIRVLLCTEAAGMVRISGLKWLGTDDSRDVIYHTLSWLYNGEFHRLWEPGCNGQEGGQGHIHRGPKLFY